MSYSELSVAIRLLKQALLDLCCYKTLDAEDTIEEVIILLETLRKHND